MRYFYDTEFIDDGRHIELISIGVVAEDGREYYAQSVEFDESKASLWVQEHVLQSLVVCPHLSGNCKGLYAHRDVGGQCAFRRIDNNQLIGACTACPWRTRAQIAAEIRGFMDIEKYGSPELWAYYGAYDHVAFAQLFGPLTNLPPGFPMVSHDISQWSHQLGDPTLPEQTEGKHIAICDARHVCYLYKFLSCIQEMQTPC